MENHEAAKKYFLSILWMTLWMTEAYPVCPANLGRTKQRVPNNNVDAFVQQENPSNTAFASCPYEAGGIITSYPANWFGAAPTIRISVKPVSGFNPQIQYFAEISSNSATSATIRVVKYTTNTPGTSSCFGGACTNVSRCSGGTCSLVSNTATCDNNCQGDNPATSCSNSCTACGGTICTSQCFFCNGSCQGACSSGAEVCLGVGAIGSSIDTPTIFAQCNGICGNCAAGTCTNPLVAGVCNGFCSQCYANCVGTTTPVGGAGIGAGACTGFASPCGGTCLGLGDCAPPVTGDCKNLLSPTTCTNCVGTGNGQGACPAPGFFSGQCSQMAGGRCDGECSNCTGTCTGTAGANCVGRCTNCIGNCIGRSLFFADTNGICSGTVLGQCSFTTASGPWNGSCSTCDGDCNGQGTFVGSECLTTCPVNGASREAAAGEVVVDFYATQ